MELLPLVDEEFRNLADMLPEIYFRTHLILSTIEKDIGALCSPLSFLQPNRTHAFSWTVCNPESFEL